MVGPIQNEAVISAGLPVATRPNLLGIGAAKAGTTWFADVLATHPDIFVPPQKELNCLHYNDLDSRLQEYAAYFRGGEAARVRCDFSVRYLASPNAPGAAARLVPDARILAILRNPLDQVQSFYWHLRRQNFNHPTPVRPAPDLFAALERFPHLLVEPALYAKHLTRWLSVFPAERFFVIDYQDATSALPETLRLLWDFLEITHPKEAVAGNQSATADGRRGVQPRGGLLGQVYPVLYSTVTRGPYQQLKRAIGVRRVEALKRALRLRQSAEAIFFKSGYPKLDVSGRKRLYEIFKDDIEALGELGFVSVSGWRPA